MQNNSAKNGRYISASASGSTDVKVKQYLDKMDSDVVHNESQRGLFVIMEKAH